MEQKRHAAAQQEELRREEGLKRQVEAELSCKVLKAVASKLTELQEAMVNDTICRLMIAMNEIAAPMLGSELVYRDGEIGYEKGATWVSHRTFSGFEKAVAYAAVSVALCSKAAVKIVMMDELGRMSVKNRIALVQLMLRLVKSGRIDQFIGVETAGDSYSGLLNESQFCLWQPS